MSFYSNECYSLVDCRKCVGDGCEFVSNWYVNITACLPPGSKTIGWDFHVDPYATDMCPVSPTTAPKKISDVSLVWLWIFLVMLGLLVGVGIFKWGKQLGRLIANTYTFYFGNRNRGEIEMHFFRETDRLNQSRQ